VFVELEIATLLIFFFSLHHCFTSYPIFFSLLYKKTWFLEQTPHCIFFHYCIKRHDFRSKVLIVFFHCCIKRRDFRSKVLIAFFHCCIKRCDLWSRLLIAFSMQTNNMVHTMWDERSKGCDIACCIKRRDVGSKCSKNPGYNNSLLKGKFTITC
jgi:hypothetical protein